jgi:hypothetical protein
VYRLQTIFIHSLLISLALFSAAPLVAQHTEVKDAGGGSKLELHYDASGQVVETRTIGPDGKLREKDVLEYPPGALVPQTFNTAYWPSGQIKKTTRDTYDNNSNFTGEFIEVFDENGKEIAGHKLTHDPQTNVYTCQGWDKQAQAYKPVDCPAGEEAGGAETVKKFTADEVRQQIAAARKMAQTPPRNSRPPSSPTAPAGTNVKEVGLILPSHIRPGERISGSVVENPTDYDGLPEILLTRVALPFAASGSASTLAGWRVEMSIEPPQSADGPIALTVPPGQFDVAILFHPVDSASPSVSKAITLPVGQPRNKSPSAYFAPAVCVKGQLCVVHGSFSGNSKKTFAAFEQRPARIIAETADAAYIAIPDATEPGSRPLVIAEGSKAIAFPMVVAEYSIHPTRRDLSKGETLLMYPTVEGPADLPDALWKPGNYPGSNLEEARKVLPEFQPASVKEVGDKREAKEKDRDMDKGKASAGEKDEDEGGEILLVVKNLTPDVASFRDSRNGMYVFHLNAAAFKMGDFSYKFVVEPIKTGTFGVQGYLIPFLAPVMGQEFPMSATQ